MTATATTDTTVEIIRKAVGDLGREKILAQFGAEDQEDLGAVIDAVMVSDEEVALKVAVEDLAELIKVVEELYEAGDEEATAEHYLGKVERLEFTFCSATFKVACEVSEKNPLGWISRFVKFLVWEKTKKLAKPEAEQFLRVALAKRDPFEPSAKGGPEPGDYELALYPKTYKKKARELVKARWIAGSDYTPIGYKALGKLWKEGEEEAPAANPFTNSGADGHPSADALAPPAAPEQAVDDDGLVLGEDGLPEHPQPGAPAPEPLTIEVIKDILALVAECIPGTAVRRDGRHELELVRLDGFPSDEEIAGWSEAEQQEVVDWAGAIHLRASDNDDVVIPPVPSVLSHREPA